jgi:L-lactate utilization protein LutB
MEEMIKKTIESLRAHAFPVEYCPGRKEAAELVLQYIPADAEVGVGGSVTIRELGLIDALTERGNRVYDHSAEGLSPQEVLATRIKQMTSDCFVCSVNAIAQTGELVSIDGVGNRINAMNFGPKKVIIVAGINKIAEDLPRALERVRNVAAPQNARRLGLALPCAKTGRCEDCDSPQRICRSIMIMERRPLLTDITVVLVGEELGY